MSRIELTGIGKRFGDREIISGLDLTIEDGSFTVLVGPSGCGKSTTLRMIAGLEEPSSGTIAIGGRSMNGVAPGHRGVAMVFQNYALYPTMTVAENIEFGLRNIGIPRVERRERVAEIAETVGLTPHLRKRPGSLSGGERQRVALARAMVKEPTVFLMDEPLSNLDAGLRQRMRAELVELHQRLRTTFVYVTHDQVEAMSMGSSIVLMRAGQVLQHDTPDALYREPLDVFAGTFLGAPPLNLIPAVAVAGFASVPAGAEWAGIRPERIGFVSPAEASKVPVLDARVTAVENLGAEQVYQVELADGTRLAVKRFDEPLRSLGERLRVRMDPDDVLWFDGEENRLLPAPSIRPGAGQPGAA